MSRPRFFTAPRKGENFELLADLNSEYRDRRKDAIKRVIANMTIGKDVSGLFASVLKNGQTDDVEQKKLVYLYLMNYAKTQPELVILAVNTFVKDSHDINPLVRALALRTMGCLRAEKIIDYLDDPLTRGLRDENPYVRKTAALCVAKLYDLKPELAIEGGFLERLQDLVADSNPSVVANAVTALADIQQMAQEVQPGSELFVIDARTLQKLLIALNECTEWGRIAILNALATYRAKDSQEAEHICERALPQFQHANGSVVLGAVKVILIHMQSVEREELKTQFIRKMAPPLVTLLSSAPEVQWVALRNVNLILQKYPDLLNNELRIFFCKYNDPSYVKVQKLEIMIKLATARNVDMLLSELKEYASEVDVDFVRRAIRAIGMCAVKIDEAAERCVHVLLDLIGTRVSYVVQEAIVVIKDIFRKYPSNYEGIIPTLCSNLEDLDEPEAKASLIWIIGEYAEKITNSADLLASFLDMFLEEQSSVQFQILTAIVKLFLKQPAAGQELVQRVLELATKEAESTDLRDRAYIYWRLLSSPDSETSKAVILAPHPPISLPLSDLPPAVLDELLGELGSLASAYHKPPSTFIGKGRMGADEVARDLKPHDLTREKALQTVFAGAHAETLIGLDDDDDDNNLGTAGGAPAAAPTQASGLGGLDELLGMSDEPAPAAGIAALALEPSTDPARNVQETANSQLNDLLGLFDAPAPAPVMGSTGTMGGWDALAGLGSATATSPSPVPAASAAAPTPAAPAANAAKPEEDLLGLF